VLAVECKYPFNDNFLFLKFMTPARVADMATKIDTLLRSNDEHEKLDGLLGTFKIELKHTLEQQRVYISTGSNNPYRQPSEAELLHIERVLHTRPLYVFASSMS
jgi:hypothetical protein